MSLLGAIFETRDLKVSNPKAWDESLWNLYGRMGHSGVNVTEHTAMSYSAVWSCVKLLSDTIASLPLKLYRKRPDDGKEEIENNQTARVMRQPNPEMPGFRLFHVLLGHLTVWGNFYCYVLRDAVGRVIQLWPLRPDLVEVKRSRNNNEIYYEFRHPEETVRLSRRDCWHVPGFGFDGIKGYSVVNQAREGIGLGMATEEFGSRFFGQGNNPGMIVEHPGKLSPDAHTNLRNSIQEASSGLSKSHMVMLLEEGMKATTALGMPHDDAQFLETRNFQAVEVCRWFRIPPHLIFELSRATYSNIEHQEIEFVQHSIRPWCVLLEKEMAHYFLQKPSDLFFEFKLQGLMRGDTPSRYQAYKEALYSGWMTPNEVRSLENMNPDKDLDFYMVPMNMTPVDQFTKEPEPVPLPLQEGTQEEGQEEEESIERVRRFLARVSGWRRNAISRKELLRSASGRYRLQSSFKPLFLEAARAVVHREMSAIKRAVTRYLGERSPQEFDAWLDEFYGDMPEYVKRRFRSVIQSYAEQIQAQAASEIGAEPSINREMQKFIDEYLEGFSQRHVAQSILQLRRLIERSDPELMAEAVKMRMDEWGEKRAEKMALNETVKGNGAFTRQTWILAGVTTIVWVTMGSKPCPYCQELDGRIIDIEHSFVTEGDFQPEGQSPMRIKTNKSHPPLHQGCVCGIVAV